MINVKVPDLYYNTWLRMPVTRSHHYSVVRSQVLRFYHHSIASTTRYQRWVLLWRLFATNWVRHTIVQETVLWDCSPYRVSILLFVSIWLVLTTRFLLDRCINATDSFECLVNTDTGTLEGANVEINESGFYGTAVTVPVIDGKFIVERPVQTIERGRLNPVCVLHEL